MDVKCAGYSKYSEDYDKNTDYLLFEGVIIMTGTSDVFYTKQSGDRLKFLHRICARFIRSAC